MKLLDELRREVRVAASHESTWTKWKPVPIKSFNLVGHATGIVVEVMLDGVRIELVAFQTGELAGTRAVESPDR